VGISFDFRARTVELEGGVLAEVEGTGVALARRSWCARLRPVARRLLERLHRMLGDDESEYDDSNFDDSQLEEEEEDEEDLEEEEDFEGTLPTLDEETSAFLRDTLSLSTPSSSSPPRDRNVHNLDGSSIGDSSAFSSSFTVDDERGGKSTAESSPQREVAAPRGVRGGAAAEAARVPKL